MVMPKLMTLLIWAAGHQPELLIDTACFAECSLSLVPHFMLQLHRFLIAVARVTVNHDGRGGSAPDPLVWDQGGQRKKRRTDIRVNVDLPGFLDGPWMQVRC